MTNEERAAEEVRLATGCDHVSAAAAAFRMREAKLLAPDPEPKYRFSSTATTLARGARVPIDGGVSDGTFMVLWFSDRATDAERAAVLKALNEMPGDGRKGE